MEKVEEKHVDLLPEQATAPQVVNVCDFEACSLIKSSLLQS